MNLAVLVAGLSYEGPEPSFSLGSGLATDFRSAA